MWVCDQVGRVGVLLNKSPLPGKGTGHLPSPTTRPMFLYFIIFSLAHHQTNAPLFYSFVSRSPSSTNVPLFQSFCLQVTIAHQKMLTFLLLFIDFWWLSKYVSNIPIWQVTYTYPSITLMVPFLLIFISKMVYQAYQEGWSVVTLTDKVMFVWSLVKDDSVLLFNNFNSNPPFDCG